jgi:mitochondrial fission protein ELM1
VYAEPERVVLPRRPGTRHQAGGLVRIYVGSEAAHWRAERVFVWSIECVRDPARDYEITWLRNLPGFERGGWTTGFTNYRFAVPQLCGARGRAIYNDVDQIYRCDPGLLFDEDLAGAGWKSIAPNDPSVMLLDCARMAEVWTLERAQRERKHRLIARAQAVPGLHATLDPRWNVRDGERPLAEAKLVHFTTLHTQPWRPFPERFVYQENPSGEAWHALERSADEVGFEMYTRERPSIAYRKWRAGRREPNALLADDAVALYHPPAPGTPPAMRAETQIADAALDELPRQDLGWVLDDLFARARREVQIRLPWDGARRSADQWSERVAATGRRYPKVHWQLALSSPRGVEWREGGARFAEAPPRVWVLADDRPGNTTQSLGLAEALGWPFEQKRLAMRALSRAHNRWLGASRAGIDPQRSSPLEPPWPDLVIAAGRRTAPVALWVRERSGGRSRTVLLGRKGGDFADLFDLAVTPRYCRLYPHPRRLEIAAPLHRASAERVAEARERFAHFGDLPSPRIALLVGGSSGQYKVGPAEAADLARGVMEMAQQAGGSVLATTSRRLGASATQALCDALAGAALVHVWRPDDAANPYLGLLAWADAFVISGDSESMLAEASAQGKPLFVARFPERTSFRALARLREWVWRRGAAEPLGARGTPRPQRGIERVCGRLIERGLVRPTRDLGRLHADLVERGVAREFGPQSARDLAFEARPLRDLDAVTARVRALMGLGASP